MEVFKPIKVENYQFMKNGLNQYEPVLVYFKDDEEEGKVYFVILWGRIEEINMAMKQPY